MTDERLERIRAVTGSDVLPDLNALDLANDLHVDQAAAALLRRFRAVDDANAFQLLVELTTERLAAIASDIAVELGLGADAFDLVKNLFSRLFLDLSSPENVPLHYLADSAEKLRVDAETMIRDLALGEVPDPEEPMLWQDGQAREQDTEAMVAQAARIGFHRLDLPFRRVLRAKDTEGLNTSDIAIRLGVPFADVEELLQSARERLARVIDDVLKGPSS